MAALSGDVRRRRQLTRAPRWLATAGGGIAWLACTAALGAALALAATVWMPDRQPSVPAASAAVVDGVAGAWTRPSASLVVSERRWRPLRVTLALRAPAEAAGPVRVHIRHGSDLVASVPVSGTAWTPMSVVVSQPPIGQQPLTLHIDSSVPAGVERGVAVANVQARPHLLSLAGLVVALLGAGVGSVVGLAWPRARGLRVRLEQGLRAPGAWLGIEWAWLPLPALTALVPPWLDRDAEALWAAPWLVPALLAHMVAGRSARVWTARWSGLAGPTPVPAALQDVLTGLLLNTTCLLTVSAVAKRVLGLGEIPSLVVPLCALALACSALIAWHHPLPGTRPLSPPRPVGLWVLKEDAIVVALLAVLVTWLGGPHVGNVHGLSTDVPQHIAWTAQIAQAGVVPDVYRGTSLPIVYPLGFHAMAFALGALTPLLPGHWVNLLPVLASILLVLVSTAAAGRLAGLDGVQGRLLTVLIAVACAFALSSTQFSVWLRYEGTGRLAAGLLHAVPLLWLAWSAGHRAPPALPVSRPARAMGVAAGSLALASGLVALVNAAHVGLQVVLSLVSFCTVLSCTTRAMPGATRPQRAVRRRDGLRGSASGLLAAAALGGVLVTAEPWSWRLAQQALGHRPPAEDILRRVDQDHNQRLTGRTCLSLSCLGRTLGSGQAWLAGPAAVAGVLGGAVETLWRGPATMISGQPDPERRWMFPDPTNRGIAPVHGPVGWVLAPAVLVLLVTWSRHTPSVRLVLVALGLALALDAVVREMGYSLTHPTDPLWRLLPQYADRGSAVVFSQALWPVVICAVVARVVHHRRRVVGAGVLVTCVLLVLLRGAMLDVRSRYTAADAYERQVTSEDVRSFLALEGAHVPPDDSYLVSAITQWSNNRKWVFAFDPSVTLYAHARRASLFLFFTSHGARYSASDLEAVCDDLRQGLAVPAPLQDTRARWVAVTHNAEGALDLQAAKRPFCGESLERWFPGLRQVAQQGRVALVRLW